MSPTAFERELTGLLPTAYRYARRLAASADEAEDLIQEASIAAFRGLETFDGTHFKAWFFKIVLNTFYRTHRRRQVATEPLEQAEEALIYRQMVSSGEVPPGDPAQAVFGDLARDRVMAALDALPSEYREVCTLYFVSEMSYEEIAEVLEIPIGTVRSRLHRGRALLQKTLWEYADAKVGN